jgi:hypothetical protein
MQELIRAKVENLARRVQGLQMAVYGRQADPLTEEDLHQQLLEAEQQLRQLEAQLQVPSSPAEVRTSSAPRGRLLGPKTTGLRVKTTLNMQPLPTGVYHLLDPETDPLLTVVVGNESRDPRRVAIKAYLEGLSAQAVKTVELETRSEITLKLLPTLLPERAKEINEIQRATAHVLVEDLDGRLESHDTFSLVCLARTSSFNAVCRPETNQLVDLSHYYGAWVTPYAEAVQALIRRAAGLLPTRQIWGYQGDQDAIDPQVGALFQSLQEAGLVYVNSVIDYGAQPWQATQRTRLPRQSLQLKGANCIDGTVLMASLLEGASLSPVLVFVPGHAFVGWETWYGSDQWRFLETTMIGGHDFAAACQSGQGQYDQAKLTNPDQLKIHRLRDLRARGIWPME